MSKRFSDYIKRITLVLAALFIAASIISTCNEVRHHRFRFVFMTDIHVQPELRAAEGFRAAIDRVNRIDPDFVITGGDLIMDALEQDYPRADSLYRLYAETSRAFLMPVYNALGNHEIFGLYPESGVPPTHPEYGKALFKKRLGEGESYRSFDHKGWHFILLDGVGMTPEGRYIGEVDDEQLAWLREDLEKTGPHRPVVMVTHIPLVSVGPQIFQGPLSAPEPNLIVHNADSVLRLCEPYNLKLVLQGHLHMVEDIALRGTRFITAGAVCGSWWRGPNYGFEEGFAVVEINGDAFSWHYEDYGWEAAEKHRRETD